MQIRKANKRSFTLWLLVFLLLFISIGALISGPLMFLAPDGHLLMWTIDMLEGSPFPNFLIPGLILFLFVGVFPLFVVYGLLRLPGWRWPDKINPFKHYHWSWSVFWATGVILLIWIITETALLGYISILQPVVAIYGITIIVLTILPDTRRFYTRNV